MKTDITPSPAQTGHLAHDSFWSAETTDRVTTLRFYDGGLVSGTDPRRTWTLWQFLDRLLDSPPAVLRISFPPGGLGQGALAGLWRYFRELASDDAAHRFPTDRAGLELRREDVALARFMSCVRDRRLFVVGDVRGEIDINLLGLLLVCDYRIAARDSVIVKRANPLGTSLGTAVPGLLASITGPSRALDLLLREEPLDARSALDLGIFHRVTPPDSHERDAAAIAARLAAYGLPYLRTLKRATGVAAPSLQSQLEATGGTGFNQIPTAPICKACGYDLTGNLSGRCPECGHDTQSLTEPLS